MILITGGMGFIGLHKARAFLDAGETIVLTQHHSRREPEFLKDMVGRRVHIERVDVINRSDLEHVVEQYDVTDIVHLVAPPLNTLPPDNDFNTSVIGLLNILQVGCAAGVRRIILASSAAVYSGISSGPFHEEMPLPVHSRSATEAFKKTLEILGWHYSDRTGMDVVAVRIGAIFGPLFWHGGIFPIVRLCYAAVRGAAASDVGDLYEEDESAPCYVKDCARGIVLLHRANRLSHRVYNLSVDWSVTNGQICEAIRKVVPDFRVALKPGTGPRHRPHPHLDVSRIRREVGYTPEYDIERSVAEYLAWLRNHPDETMAVARLY